MVYCNVFHVGLPLKSPLKLQLAKIALVLSCNTHSVGAALIVGWFLDGVQKVVWIFIGYLPNYLFLIDYAHPWYVCKEHLLRIPIPS